MPAGLRLDLTPLRMMPYLCAILKVCNNQGEKARQHCLVKASVSYQDSLKVYTVWLSQYCCGQSKFVVVGTRVLMLAEGCIILRLLRLQHCWARCAYQ